MVPASEKNIMDKEFFIFKICLPLFTLPLAVYRYWSLTVGMNFICFFIVILTETKVMVKSRKTLSLMLHNVV